MLYNMLISQYETDVHETSLQNTLSLLNSISDYIRLWKTCNSSASQEIPLILRNPKVHYRFHKSSTLFHTLSDRQMHSATSHRIFCYVFSYYRPSNCAFPSGCPTNPLNTVPFNKTNENADKNCICRKDFIYYSTHCHVRVKSDSKTLFQEANYTDFLVNEGVNFPAIPHSTKSCIFLKQHRPGSRGILYLPAWSMFLTKYERDSIVSCVVARNWGEYWTWQDAYKGGKIDTAKQICLLLFLLLCYLQASWLGMCNISDTVQFSEHTEAELAASFALHFCSSGGFCC
jgi:hypothetical protein